MIFPSFFRKLYVGSIESHTRIVLPSQRVYPYYPSIHRISKLMPFLLCSSRNSWINSTIFHIFPDLSFHCRSHFERSYPLRKISSSLNLHPSPHHRAVHTDLDIFTQLCLFWAPWVGGVESVIELVVYAKRISVAWGSDRCSAFDCVNLILFLLLGAPIFDG